MMIKHSHFTDLIPYQKQQLRSPVRAGRWGFEHQTWDWRGHPPPSAGPSGQEARRPRPPRSARPGLTHVARTSLPVVLTSSAGPAPWRPAAVSLSVGYITLSTPAEGKLELDQRWSRLCLQLPVRGRESILIINVFKINPGHKRAAVQAHRTPPMGEQRVLAPRGQADSPGGLLAPARGHAVGVSVLPPWLRVSDFGPALRWWKMRVRTGPAAESSGTGVSVLA